MFEGCDKAFHAAQIMIVDDNPGNLSYLESVLTEEGYLVRAVNSSVFALKSIRAHLPDLLLLDVKMPEVDGYELCRRLKADPHTKKLPVIFVSVLNRPEDQVKGFDIGAVDYISKPIHRQEVLARVRTHISLYFMQTKLEALVEERTKEIRQSTTELLKTTDLLKAVHEANPDLQFVLDSTGVITNYHVHDEAELYRPPEQFIGKKMQDVLPDKVGEQFLSAIAQAVSSSSLVTIEYVLSMPDKGRTFEARIVSLKDGRIVVTARDISERKEAETEKARVLTERQQSQKMEAIGVMAGGISHDFNNMLAIITGYVELAIGKVRLGIDLQDEDLEATTTKEQLTQRRLHWVSLIECLQKVQIATDRATKLVKQLLVFGRPGKSRLEFVNPASTVKECLSLMRSTIPSTVMIKQGIDSNCGLINADKTQLSQIVMNLCNNAVYAMDEKGEISVTLSPIELSIAAGNLPNDKKSGTYVRLTVKDSGIGMEQAIIDRLYDPFFTTKKVGEGTGIGMTVVYGLVEHLGGIIRVRSEKGVGSQFDIDFPQVSGGQLKSNGEIVDTIPSGQERILLVDDEEAIAETVKELLEQYGYNVVSMTDSGSALRLFQADPVVFDLIITDQSMPSLSGLEMAEEMLALKPDLPIILCTGFSSKTTASELQRIGIKTILSKPVPIVKLAHTIRSLLDLAKQ